MTHSEIRNRLGRYLEGDLSLRQRALFDAHLDHCESCSQELQSLRETVWLLRSMPPMEAPASFTQEVMERVRAGESQRRWFDFLKPGPVPRNWSWLGAPLATAAVAGMAFAMVWTNGTIPWTNPGLPRSADQRPVREAVPMPRPEQRGLNAAEAAARRAQALAELMRDQGSPSLPITGLVGASAEITPQEEPGFSREVREPILSLASVSRSVPEPAAGDLTRALEKALNDPAQFVAELSRRDRASRERWLRELAGEAARSGVALDVAMALVSTRDPRATPWALYFQHAAERSVLR